MPAVSLWMILVPPYLRPTDDQITRMDTHMRRRFPDLDFKVMQSPFGGTEISAIPNMGSVGDGVWKDKPEMPTEADRERIAQVAREFDPGASYGLN